MSALFPALLIAFLLADISPEFSAPCVSHIPESWTGNARAAALADCSFSDESQTTGAAAWEKYAAPDAAAGPSRGPAEIRAAQARSYARPGYRLIWYPTEAKAMGSFVLTTGRWERHVPQPDGGLRVLHGHYITMWQKQPDGAFRWVWDGGEADAPAQ